MMRGRRLCTILMWEDPNHPPPPLYLCTYPRLQLPAVIAISHWWIRLRWRPCKWSGQATDPVAIGARTGFLFPLPSTFFFPSLHQITTGGHLRQSSIIEVNLHTGQSYTSHTWNCTRVCDVVALNSVSRMKLLICSCFPFPRNILAKLREYWSSHVKSPNAL